MPSDLNATIMYEDFKEKYPETKVSYELYRKFLKKDMNHLGNEECEDCESYKIHQSTCKEPESCDECTKYNLHRKKFKKAWTLYPADVDLAATNSEKVFYSSDLQKVIMLPRIDMLKFKFKINKFLPQNHSI